MNEQTLPAPSTETPLTSAQQRVRLAQSVLAARQLLRDEPPEFPVTPDSLVPVRDAQAPNSTDHARLTRIIDELRTTTDKPAIRYGAESRVLPPDEAARLLREKGIDPDRATQRPPYDNRPLPATVMPSEKPRGRLATIAHGMWPTARNRSQHSEPATTLPTPDSAPEATPQFNAEMAQQVTEIFTTSSSSPTGEIVRKKFVLDNIGTENFYDLHRGTLYLWTENIGDRTRISGGGLIASNGGLIAPYTLRGDFPQGEVTDAFLETIRAAGSTAAAALNALETRRAQSVGETPNAANRLNFDIDYVEIAPTTYFADRARSAPPKPIEGISPRAAVSPNGTTGELPTTRDTQDQAPPDPISFLAEYATLSAAGFSDPGIDALLTDPDRKITMKERVIKINNALQEHPELQTRLSELVRQRTAEQQLARTEEPTTPDPEATTRGDSTTQTDNTAAPEPDGAEFANTVASGGGTPPPDRPTTEEEPVALVTNSLRPLELDSNTESISARFDSLEQTTPTNENPISLDHPGRMSLIRTFESGILPRSINEIGINPEVGLIIATVTGETRAIATIGQTVQRLRNTGNETYNITAITIDNNQPIIYLTNLASNRPFAMPLEIFLRNINIERNWRIPRSDDLTSTVPAEPEGQTTNDDPLAFEEF